MKNKILILSLLFLCSISMQAQWVDFIDETDTRIVVSNVNDNSDPNAMDDMEKDLAVADFNNDGFDDLVVVRKVPFSIPGRKTDLLFMNENGVLVDKTDMFAPQLLSSNSDARDVICTDINGDGWIDLFIVSTFDDQPKLLVNQGEDGGQWQGFVDESATRLPTVTVDIIQFCAGWSGDLTGNGAPDLYMVNYDSTGMALDVLFINDGNGNFTDETQSRMGALRNSSFGTGVEFHDIDNDGDLDIIKNLGLGPIAPFNVQGTIALFNEGDGTFDNFFKLPGATSYMFTAGDLNDDGMLDFYEVDDADDYVNFIVAVNPDVSVTIDQEFINSNRTDVWGGNVKYIDIDGDGDLDVSIASVDTDEPPCDTSIDIGQSGGVRTFTFFENEGLHTGNIIDPYNNNDQIWHISNYDQDFIDINNDGFMDLIMGACEGYKIFMQEPLLNVTEEIFDASFVISPNPTDGTITINLSTAEISKLEIDILNIHGVRLSTIQFDTVISNILKVDLHQNNLLSSGMYFLKMKTDKGIVSKKVIVE